MTLRDLEKLFQHPRGCPERSRKDCCMYRPRNHFRWSEICL